MRTFLVFLDKIVDNYTPKLTKLQLFKKISQGSLPPNPLASTWLCHALHMALRACKYLHFSKINLNPSEIKS